MEKGPYISRITLTRPIKEDRYLRRFLEDPERMLRHLLVDG